MIFWSQHGISSITSFKHLYEVLHVVGLNDGQLYPSSHHPVLIFADDLRKSFILTWMITFKDCIELVVWTPIPNYWNVWALRKFVQVLVPLRGYWFEFQSGNCLSWLRFLVPFLSTSRQMPGKCMKLATDASRLFLNHYLPVILSF
jgi:hypothetical protein